MAEVQQETMRVFSQLGSETGGTAVPLSGAPHGKDGSWQSSSAQQVCGQPPGNPGFQFRHGDGYVSNETPRSIAMSVPSCSDPAKRESVGEHFLTTPNRHESLSMVDFAISGCHGASLTAPGSSNFGDTFQPGLGPDPAQQALSSQDGTFGSALALDAVDDDAALAAIAFGMDRGMSTDDSVASVDPFFGEKKLTWQGWFQEVVSRVGAQEVAINRIAELQYNLTLDRDINAAVSETRRQVEIIRRMGNDTVAMVREFAAVLNSQ